MAIISIGDLAELLDGRLHLGQMPSVDGPYEVLPKIATDFASLQPGELYWELPRQRFTAPADIAFSKGAAGIVSNREIEPWAGRFSLRVQDPEKSLGILASWSRQRFTGAMIAVQAPPDETSATRTIARLLGCWGRSRAVQHHCQETSTEFEATAGLCGVDEDDRYAVLELHPGDFFGRPCISHLCCPHVAVIYRLHKSTANHLSVRSAVTQLLSEIPESGFAILNGDEPLLREMSKNCQAKCLWFAKTPRNDVTVSCHLKEKDDIALRTSDGTVQVRPPQAPGTMEHWMAACCVAIALQTPAEQIRREMESLAKVIVDSGQQRKGAQPVDAATRW